MNDRRNAIPRIIYVMGIDGSGKSTVSEHLAAKLREKGRKVHVEWLRFNHVLSKPLLGLCRLIGLTRYETQGGIRVGYHDFHRSKIVSWLFVFFQYLDAARVLYTRILPKIRDENSVLILDRYVYDILVDLIVDTRMEGLYAGRVGRAFRRLLPEDALLILVDRSLDAVLDVRPEGRVDRNFLKRYECYRQIAKEGGVNTIANDGELADLLRTVESCVGI